MLTATGAISIVARVAHTTVIPIAWKVSASSSHVARVRVTVIHIYKRKLSLKSNSQVVNLLTVINDGHGGGREGGRVADVDGWLTGGVVKLDGWGVADVDGWLTGGVVEVDGWLAGAEVDGWLAGRVAEVDGWLAEMDDCLKSSETRF